MKQRVQMDAFKQIVKIECLFTMYIDFMLFAQQKNLQTNKLFLMFLELELILEWKRSLTLTE